MNNELIIIEDDKKICDLLVDYLGEHGFQSLAFQSPLQGLEELEKKNHALLILDIMMPEIDGFEVLRRLRKFTDIPVIILTARGETTDKIVGLELGADDYLSKPFEPRELVARINAILKRRRQTSGSTQIFGDLVISRESRRIELAGQEVALTSLEFDLLELLSREVGKRWTRDEIMNSLHGHDSDVFSRAIDIAVSRLRQKLGDSREKWIQTIRGTGYSFIGDKS